MKRHLQLGIVLVAGGVVSSCASRAAGESSFIREAIPIEIQHGKPVTIEIHTRSPGGKSEVGIRCSPEVWNTLTNGTEAISIELVSSNKKNVQVFKIHSGYDAACPVKSFYDLCYLYGMNHQFPKATVRIHFPNAPAGITRAEILVCRTSADNL
jgi:hypothetical protein